MTYRVLVADAFPSATRKFAFAFSVAPLRVRRIPMAMYVAIEAVRHTGGEGTDVLDFLGSEAGLDPRVALQLLDRAVELHLVSSVSGEN